MTPYILSEHPKYNPNYAITFPVAYEKVECLKDDEARAEFDRIAYDKAIRFHDGYSRKITDVTETGKISAVSLGIKIKEITL